MHMSVLTAAISKPYLKLRKVSSQYCKLETKQLQSGLPSCEFVLLVQYPSTRYVHLRLLRLKHGPRGEKPEQWPATYVMFKSMVCMLRLRKQDLQISFVCLLKTRSLFCLLKTNSHFLNCTSAYNDQQAADQSKSKVRNVPVLCDQRALDVQCRLLDPRYALMYRWILWQDNGYLDARLGSQHRNDVLHISRDTSINHLSHYMEADHTTSGGSLC